MKKERKMSDNELASIDAGTIYVSVDGGEKIRAIPICSGGTLQLKFTLNGEKKRFDTGVNLSAFNPVGNIILNTYYLLDSQDIINITHDISMKDENVQ